MDGCKLSFSFTLPDKTFQRVELVRELQLNISLLSLFFFFFKAAEFLKYLKSSKVATKFTHGMKFRVLFRVNLGKCRG